MSGPSRELLLRRDKAKDDRITELEAEQTLHDAIFDASTARAELAESDLARVTDGLGIPVSDHWRHDVPMTTGGVGLINDVVPPDRVEDGDE